MGLGMEGLAGPQRSAIVCLGMGIWRARDNLLRVVEIGEV